VPGYVHAIELALQLGDDTRARRYSTTYAALGAEDRDAAGMLIVDRVIRRDLRSSADLEQLLEHGLDRCPLAGSGLLPTGPG
jgi:hypothetical protein